MGFIVVTTTSMSVARDTNYSHGSIYFGAHFSPEKRSRKKRRLAAPQNRQWYSVNTGIKSTPEKYARQQCQHPQKGECNRLHKIMKTVSQVTQNQTAT